MKWVNEKALNENWSAFTNLVTHEIRNIDNGRRRISAIFPIYCERISFRWENKKMHKRRINRIEIVSFEPKNICHAFHVAAAELLPNAKLNPVLIFV